MDIIPRERRSALMSRIRGKDTGPELIVRSTAHALGYRFRLHRRDLPGSPDLVFPRLRKVVFVHGCFWHRHDGCRFAYGPKSNTAFWEAKFAGNVQRDGLALQRLQALGWKTLVVWECETRDRQDLERRLASYLGDGKGEAMDYFASSRELKLARLQAGADPRVLELCSGCGGLSLGLEAAGFALAAHIEADPVANLSHALNFGPADPKRHQAWSRPRDMVKTKLDSLVKEFGLPGRVPEAFDILAGGLPCQAFARIGRSKLRSVTGDDEAFRNDPRASLYRRFLQFVEEARPLAIVLENVPDILNFGGHNIPEEISETLDELGYVSRYTLLNAAFYGVPQMRERLFLIAIDGSLGVTPKFPAPTHSIVLPRGYEGSRNVALKHVQREGSHFSPLLDADFRLPPAVSTQDALGDLPFISDHLRDPSIIRRRKVSDLLPYREDQQPSTYSRKMREWSGFSTNGMADGHVIRLTTRDFPIFGRMPRGGDYPVALQVAYEILDEKIAELPANRQPGPRSREYARLLEETVPPYDVNKFPNKWWKLDPAAPSRTLTAHLGKDAYSHIHYDGRQKRTISVREAARLQSFPDGFRFAGAMNSSFRQIGNAVPPLLAFAVASELKRTLTEAVAGLGTAGARRAA